jgi:hypothetical protein
MSKEEARVSRRNLLVGLAGTAAVGAVAVTEGGQQQVAAFKNMLWKRQPGNRYARLANASVDDWALKIGSTFTTSTGHTFKLTDVRQFGGQGKRPAGLRDRPFVAGFQVVSGPATLPKEITLAVTGSDGQSFDMFNTAGSRDKPDRRIAVFG